MPRNVGIYVRVSTEHQVKEGYSVAAQKSTLLKKAAEMNLDVYSIYSDEGISGKNIQDRPEVRRLIDDIELEKVQVVLTYKFDRITRDVSDTEKFIRLIEKYNIQICTLSDGDIDVNSSHGRLATRIKGVIGQFEREQTVERIKFGFEQKVREGYSLCSATPPYGYNKKKGNKILSINKNEALIVKKIFKMYLENNTFTEIAKTLNIEGVKPKKYGRIITRKSSNGKIIKEAVLSIWQAKTIRLIITNPTYIGKVRYGIGKSNYFESDGKHKAIIDIETWNKVQEKINKMRKSFRTNLPKDDVYYCGVLVCGICGKKLTTTRTNGRIKKDGTKTIFNGYRCINREKGICEARGISHSKVENSFLKYLDSMNDLTEIETIKYNYDNSFEKISSIKKQLVNYEKKLKDIMNMFLVNAINHEQLIYMSQKVEKNIEMLNMKIKELEINRREHIDLKKARISPKVKEHWEYLTNKEKLFFLVNFVEQIVIVNEIKDKHNGKPQILDVKFYE